MRPGGSRLEETPDCCKAEDRGKVGRGWRAQERQRRPVACEDVRRAEAQPAVAETQGRGGEAINMFAVEAGTLQRLCGETVGGCVGELSQQTDCTDGGCLCPCALAAEVESREQVLT